MSNSKNVEILWIGYFINIFGNYINLDKSDYMSRYLDKCSYSEFPFSWIISIPRVSKKIITKTYLYPHESVQFLSYSEKYEYRSGLGQIICDPFLSIAVSVEACLSKCIISVW